MRPIYYVSPTMPALAWLAWHTTGDVDVHIVHGRDVEVQPHFFVEGAWAGSFPLGDLHQAESVFGSGAVFESDEVTFVSSSATTDYLYYQNSPEHFRISNSLPALLAGVADELPNDFIGYVEINRSIQDGIHDYKAEIPTTRGSVRRVLWWNVRLVDNRVRLVEKAPPPEFACFTDYRDHLARTTRELFENARQRSRRKPMAVYSTQSGGYDSTAANALAAPFGIDRVFSSPESKENAAFYYRGGSINASDDGADICRALGLPCTHISRRAFEAGVPDEHYYWACHDNNQDFNLHEVHRHIERPTLLLTGQLGETWYTQRCAGAQFSNMNNDSLFCWSQVGHGLAEIRLVSKYPPAEPGALGCEPLKAAGYGR